MHETQRPIQRHARSSSAIIDIRAGRRLVVLHIELVADLLARRLSGCIERILAGNIIAAAGVVGERAEIPARRIVGSRRPFRYRARLAGSTRSDEHLPSPVCSAGSSTKRKNRWAGCADTGTSHAPRTACDARPRTRISLCIPGEIRGGFF